MNYSAHIRAGRNKAQCAFGRTREFFRRLLIKTIYKHWLVICIIVLVQPAASTYLVLEGLDKVQLWRIRREVDMHS